MNILGIESTCDETSASVVKDGQKILSNIVASSVDLQKKYGGVVPEVAAREQIKVIVPVIAEALIKVNHLVGHIYANWLQPMRHSNDQIPNPKFPLIALIVSGGHTDLVLVKGHGDYKLIGTTLDDAAGETFDKVARLLGLPYPGGGEIERLASKFTNSNFQTPKIILPRPMIGSKDLNFSFSGLKTAVFNILKNDELKIMNKAEIADEVQKAIVDVLVKKTINASQQFDCSTIVIGGGVSANRLLRSQMTDNATRLKIKTFCPSENLCVDNGAVIAVAGFYNQD